jgi:hypothetical protein
MHSKNTEIIKWKLYMLTTLNFNIYLAYFSHFLSTLKYVDISKKRESYNIYTL